MKTFKIAALCLSMAAAAFTVQAKEVKYEADVAIVGGGPAGMVAAAYAAENGLKPILVEKLPGVGGNLMMLEITFGQRTRFTDQDQVYYPSDELIADFLAYSHYMVNPIMVRRFIERSGENIKWLTNRGVEIVGNTATELNGRRVGHIYKNVFPHRNFIEAMRKIILDNGGQIIVETRADKLIQNADGRVVGLHAKNYLNEDVIVHAKGGVILTAGGYGANPKLLKLLNPDMPADTPITGRKNSTGDGIQMGIDIGAKTAGGEAFISEGALPYKVDYREVINQKTWIAANVLNKGPSLQLNKNGRRFFNEGLSGDFSVSGNALRINGNYLYTLVDDDEKRDLETGSGAVFGYFGHALPGDKMTGSAIFFPARGEWLKLPLSAAPLKKLPRKPVWIPRPSVLRSIATTNSAMKASTPISTKIAVIFDLSAKVLSTSSRDSTRFVIPPAACWSTKMLRLSVKTEIRFLVFMLPVRWQAANTDHRMCTTSQPVMPQPAQ